MELFDKRFVHFMWDDRLIGKKCFLADYINELQSYVEKGDESNSDTLAYSEDKSAPFKPVNRLLHRCRFAYFDPNYEVKRAFNEGKTIQFLSRQQQSNGGWTDVWYDCVEPRFIENTEYRVKPEEEKWIVYLARKTNGSCYLSACAESCWKAAQKELGAKTKLFVGTKSEVNEWYEPRQKFAEVIKAWEDGKQIQFLNCGQWEDRRGKPLWSLTNVYREKPECPCEKGIDSKACVGCPQSEGGKKKWRPYINSAEMVADFIARFKANCSTYCEPLIWLKSKDDLERALITNYYGGTKVLLGGAYRTIEKLFEDYTYLDGSPCGMEVK